MTTPNFVSNYIAFLSNLQSSDPETFNSVLGVNDGQNISFTSQLEDNSGWTVSSIDNITGQIIKKEFIEPTVTKPILGGILNDDGTKSAPPKKATPIIGRITNLVPPSSSSSVINNTLSSNNISNSVQSYISTSYSLEKPLLPPNNVFVASSVNDMISFVPNNDITKFIYDIGIPSKIQPITYTIRNNTIANPLEIIFFKPSFTRLNTQSIIQLQPLQQITVSVSFDESVAKNLSLQNIKIFNESFSWKVKPLNVSGPIYIQSGLPALIDPKIPFIQETTSINTIDSSNINITTLFAALDPPITNIKSGEHATVKLNLWVGNDSVGPNAPGAILLNFGQNSVQWSTSNSTILDIDNLNGTGIITFMGLIPGTTDITAKILSNPTNITPDKWNRILNNTTGSNITVDNVIKLTGMVNING